MRVPKTSNPVVSARRIRERFLVFGAPAIEEAEIEEVLDCFKTGWLGTGPKVARFEQEFLKYRQGAHAIAVNSGTAALHLSLLAAGIGPGDEVITTPLTFCATVNAILHAGATPVLADIDPETGNIDPAQIRSKVTSRTRAILPVHLAGRPCSMDEILKLAATHDLRVIEDCAHAIETDHRGRPAGTLGDFGCFSFYVTKNMTTGEGGMILARRPEDAEKLRRLALHGLSHDAWKRFGDRGYRHYDVVDLGFKYNMTDLQAALGIHQLRSIEEKWLRRREIWERYQEAFSDLPVVRPAGFEPQTRHGLHLYTLLIDESRSGISRDDVLDEMTRRKIGVGVHYRSLPEHQYYRQTLHWRPEDYPHAMRWGRETISIPLAANLTDEDVEDVINAVRASIPSRVARSSQTTTVTHSLPFWIPLTSPWLYNQVRYLPRTVENRIVCEWTENLDQYDLPGISALDRTAAVRSNAVRTHRPERYLPFLRDQIRLNGSKILHSHWGDVAWRNLPVVREFGIGHVVTFYGKDVNFIPTQQPLWRERYRELFAQVDRVLCEGPHMAACIRALGCPAEKVLVHPLGIEVEHIPFSPRTWRPGETLRVLIGASFREKKGIPIALEALGRLARVMPGVEITLIGDANADPRSQREKQRVLEVLGRCNLSSRTRLLGYQPHSVFLEEARRHHVFVSPSLTADDGDTEGGAPVSLIEMAASGIPIVSTTHCDIPSVILHGQSGLLAPEGSVEGVLECLHQLLAAPQSWSDMLRRGREHVEERFDARRQGPALERIYQSLEERVG